MVTPMSMQEYEYLVQRKKESIYDLYDTVATRRRILTAKIIDWMAFFVIFGTIAALVYYYQHILYPTGFILIALLLVQMTLGTITKGKSLGNMLLGIRFVSVETKKRVSRKEYFEYMKKYISFNVKYKELFRYYFSYNSRLSQNQPIYIAYQISK